MQLIQNKRSASFLTETFLKGVIFDFFVVFSRVETFANAFVVAFIRES